MSEGVCSRVAAIQMVSSHDIRANLAEAERLLAEAAGQGAGVAVLPENFAVLASSQMVDCGRKEAGPDPVIRAFLAEQARKLGIARMVQISRPGSVQPAWCLMTRE